MNTKAMCIILFCTFAVLSVDARVEVKKGNAGGNSGDPIELIFTQATRYAAHRVLEVSAKLMTAQVDAKVKDWILANRVQLAADIMGSAHIWENTQHTSCALTGLTPNADILLSYVSCRESILTPTLASELLIHESVHHFGFADETFCDAVATTIFNSAPSDYKCMIGQLEPDNPLTYVTVSPQNPSLTYNIPGTPIQAHIDLDNIGSGNLDLGIGEGINEYEYGMGRAPLGTEYLHLMAHGYGIFCNLAN